MQPYRAIQYFTVLFVLAAAILIGCEAHSSPREAAPGADGYGADFDGRDAYVCASREVAAGLPAASTGGTGSTTEPGYSTSIQPGTLTAGCFDDTAEPMPYTTFIAGLSDAQGPIAALAGQFADEPLILLVTDMHDTPLPNVRITLPKGDADAARTVITGTDGRAIFFDGWDKLTDRMSNDELPMTLTVNGQPIEAAVAATSGTHTVTLPVTKRLSANTLDLVFVVDCTGSMGDELEYLKVELKSIVEHIATQFPEVAQRYALVVYRDDGDEYVTRTIDFTDSLQAFMADLGRQSSDGGGDYPEAVDQALADATALSWSNQGVRMLFHVADAPPHDDKAPLALEATDALREKGVAVYPVASSGVADVAEFIMRTEAMLTGGQYVFLTDDSGVGNTHAEPHFPHYVVQTLRDVMIRMIASELAGETVEPNPDRIIRRVEAQPADGNEQ